MHQQKSNSREDGRPAQQVPLPGSQVIRADHIRYLREATGCGLSEAKSALEKFNGDSLLAEGWLRNAGLAVNVCPRAGETIEQAYDRWVMDRVYAFKTSMLAGHLPI